MSKSPKQSQCRAAYWLEELGKDRVQDASGLLGKALELLRQYKAAPALQLEVQAAYEVRMLALAADMVPCSTCLFF